MLCRKQPRFLADKPVQIQHLLEIRLAPAQWNRLKLRAWQGRRTYSTIVRFCVFRLVRLPGLHWTARFRRAETAVAAGLAEAQEMRRHMLCLYGADEKLIRLAAMELGLTMTALVRLALQLFLPTLAMEKHSQRPVARFDFTWQAIRITEQVQVFAVNGGGRPFYRHITFENFDPGSYWL